MKVWIELSKDFRIVSFIFAYTKIIRSLVCQQLAMRGVPQGFCSISQRKRQANSHEESSTDLIETLSHSLQPRTNPLSQAGQAELCDNFHQYKSSSHQDKLRDEFSLCVNKLRQKGSKKRIPLGLVTAERASSCKNSAIQAQVFRLQVERARLEYRARSGKPHQPV